MAVEVAAVAAAAVEAVVAAEAVVVEAAAAEAEPAPEVVPEAGPALAPQEPGAVALAPADQPDRLEARAADRQVALPAARVAAEMDRVAAMVRQVAISNRDGS